MAKKYDHDEHRDNVKAAFRKTLKKLVANSGNTDAAVSAEMGCTRSQLSNWQNGKAFPDEANLVRIADYFHVSIDYLFGRGDDQQYTTAGEVVEAIERIERSVSSAIDSSNARVTSYGWNDIGGGDGTLKITIYNNDIAAFFHERDSINTVVTNNPGMETYRQLLLSKLYDNAHTAKLPDISAEIEDT